MASREQSPTGASERTPLLTRDEETSPESEATESTKKHSRLPSFIALGILTIAVVLAIVFGFAAPAAVEEYAKEAITFEPTDLSIDSFTSVGIRARVQGVFYLDGSKVHKTSVRNLGRAATWIAKEVESGEAEVEIYLPEYENSLLGIVKIPPMKLNIRNGHDNFIDIISDIETGDINGIRRVAQDVIGGKRSLSIKAIATAPVKSGLINLGTKTVTTFMTLHQEEDMKPPKFDITNLRVAEYGLPGHPEGVKATADVTAMNRFPIKFNIPPLAFEVMLPDCSATPLMLGTMNIAEVHVQPKQNVTAAVTGFMRQLPTQLTQACPDTRKSPLDTFIGSYLGGKDTKVYVRGGHQDLEHTPRWIGDILRDTTVAVPVPVHPFKNMIKDFSLSDVHFSLPELGENANPMLSAIVNVVVGLPKDINIEVSVDRVRADADVFYEGRKLGELDLHEWQTANSSKIDDALYVQSIVKNAPLKITDQDVFTQVLQSMIFGGKGITLGVHASVDVRSATALGQFVVRKIPADGEIFIKPIGGKMQHTVKEIAVVGSSPEELVMQATVDVQNPTEYSAHIPYVNISVWCNETQLGYAWGSFDVGPGSNEIVVQASYAAGHVGAEFLSQYISGWNSSLTMKTFNGSIPGLPNPDLAVTVPIPHMFGKFLRETTMHILSSTATFILFSPLPMFVTSISAKAFYRGKDIGLIKFDTPFEIKVGENETPRLPVDWNTDGGFGLIRDALGGQLKLDAHADVGVRIGEWEELIWYEAKGMGAKVRL